MEFTNSKLVINRISTEMDERILRRHFNAYGYGEVKHVIVYFNKAIAFVTFVDPSKTQITPQQQYIILGRKVETRPAKPKVEIGKRKIFVGGFPRSITNEEFKGYFEKFGSIVDAVVIHDKKTKRSRGFGFVTYEAKESANLVLRTHFHLLNNKRVEVKKVTPRQEMVPTGFLIITIHIIKHIFTPSGCPFLDFTEPHLEIFAEIVYKPEQQRKADMKRFVNLLS
ncbi:hypothetical protein V6Z11_A12G096500 [Gossypium hirsutum]|nr:hypothetical protein ES332_A12G094700v1 [Gossypium tomentosum]